MNEEGKYGRINKQMKFEFLRKVLGEGLSICKAAHQVGINYSTAKTILFFHKNKHKSYRVFKMTVPLASSHQAHFRPLTPQEPYTKIAIISNNRFQKWEPRKEVKAGNIALTYLRSGRQATKNAQIVVERVLNEQKMNTRGKKAKNSNDKIKNELEDSSDLYDPEDE